jgi:hypothetical protein
VPGSVDAFVLDRDLALRLDAEERKDEEPMSTADAADAIPAYDEGQLPDPFSAPPKELGRLA